MREKMPGFPENNTNRTMNAQAAFGLLIGCLSLGRLPTQDSVCKANDSMKDIRAHGVPPPASTRFHREVFCLQFK